MIIVAIAVCHEEKKEAPFNNRVRPVHFPHPGLLPVHFEKVSLSLSLVRTHTLLCLSSRF